MNDSGSPTSSSKSHTTHHGKRGHEVPYYSSSTSTSVTAEWSEHGFAGTEEEQCGGDSHPQDANNEQR